jgi:cell division protease FtsH
MLLVVLIALQQRKGGIFSESDKPLTYTAFIQNIKEEKVKSGKLLKDRFEGEYLPPRPVTATTDEFTVLLPESSETRNTLTQLLLEHHVPFEVRAPILSDWMQGLLFSVMLPLVFIAVFWIIFIRQAQSGGNQALSFGRSRAKRLTDNVPKVTFEDVAGVDEAKQELQEIVEFLKNAKKFQALGAKIPKGVLLLGPPGCGKTMLARAIAGEAGVPFFHISGSDFVELFVGVGASRVRDLFDTAKSNRPSLIFIDEIDAVGRQRGAGLGGGHDEREQTLNQLLVEMDGFDPNAGVIMIAATNRPDVLDPALLRPGRFDRRVVVDGPDARGRKEIFRVHMRGKPLEWDNNDVEREKALESLAKRTPGFTGADIANLVNEAALLAARRDKTRVSMPEFEESIDRVIAGPERKSRLLTDRDKRVVAYHEVGHAIVGESLEHSDPVHKLSILPRGMALGYTISLPTEDRYNVSRSYLEDKIAELLGGRVAEEVVYTEITTGASNDLDRATDMARAMVCEYGMSERLGPLRFGRRHGNPFLGRDFMEDRDYSEEVAQAIDEEVRGIVDRQYQRAKQLLLEKRDLMDKIVEVLMVRETLERDDFMTLMEGRELAPLEEPPTSPPPAPSGEQKEPENKRQRTEPRLRAEPGPA